MDEPLRLESTPAEYFRTLVQQAIQRQRVKTTETVECYLVNLLVSFVDPARRWPYNQEFSMPLALRLDAALDSNYFDRAIRLRHLADTTLLVSGFFSDSLKRNAVDIDYYVGIGRTAYGTLARNRESKLWDVYFELCRQFVPFMDVLMDVSEQTTTHSELDRYRWNQIRVLTGSRYALNQSIRYGFIPAKVGKRYLQ